MHDTRFEEHTDLWGCAAALSPHIADLKRGVLSEDQHFDCGADEVPLLDRHFGVSTVVYFSAGQGTFVACDGIQPG